MNVTIGIYVYKCRWGLFVYFRFVWHSGAGVTGSQSLPWSAALSWFYRYADPGSIASEAAPL